MIAVKRGNEIIPSPGLEFVFTPGDIVYLIGSKENLSKAFALLSLDLRDRGPSTTMEKELSLVV